MMGKLNTATIFFHNLEMMRSIVCARLPSQSGLKVCTDETETI
jgi:hypothetical protein